jgi:anthranilate phosphoribosyltransferase
VYSSALVHTIGEVLLELGAERAYVVHGAGGIDELSPVGPTVVCEIYDGRVHSRTIDPEELGIERCDVAALRGGSPADNAAAVRAVISGAEQGGSRDAILMNAAGAIAAGGHAADLREGIELARQAVDSGAAAARLEELIAFTQAEEATA